MHPVLSRDILPPVLSRDINPFATNANCDKVDWSQSLSIFQKNIYTEKTLADTYNSVYILQLMQLMYVWWMHNTKFCLSVHWNAVKVLCNFSAIFCSLVFIALFLRIIFLSLLLITLHLLFTCSLFERAKHISENLHEKLTVKRTYNWR